MRVEILARRPSRGVGGPQYRFSTMIFARLVFYKEAGRLPGRVTVAKRVVEAALSGGLLSDVADYSGFSIL